MEPGRRPRADQRPGQRHTARHSTGGFLGSRSARVVAAGLTVSIGVVGGVVVAERFGDAPTQAQVLPPVVSSSPPVVAAPTTPPAREEPVEAERVDVEAPAPEVVDPVEVAEVVEETPTVTSPVERVPVVPVVQVPDVQVPVAEVPALEVPAVPVAPESQPEPEPELARVLLQTTVDVPQGWEVPTGAVSLDVPLPDPVTVTGQVSSPETGRLEVEITLAPGARHVADDPAPETTADVLAGLDRVARHRNTLAPAG